MSSNAKPADPVATVRVRLTTYRRPALLPRAIDSLRAQSFTDWICDLHNDAPDDPAPAELLRRIGDPRIRLCTPAQNRGALATFNDCYRPPAEPYHTLLEDDNWWERDFLSTMLEALAHRPDVTLAWCNQRIWRELADGSWHDTGTDVNNEPCGSIESLIPWGSLRQAIGALHANGAMLLRTRPAADYATPVDLPFAGVESFRERMFPHPLLYIHRTLAHYSLTLRTARDRDLGEWSAFQTALLASFVRHANLSPARAEELWQFARGKTPPVTNVMLHAALSCPGCRGLLRHARGGDWWRYLRGIARRPAAAWRALRMRQRHPAWWSSLDRNTAARFAVA